MLVNVIRDTDSVYIGTMQAFKGMKIKNGAEIIKVNERSVIVSSRHSDEKITEASVWYTDAVLYGFDEIETHILEYKAAKRRQFAEGEWWFEQKGDFVDEDILQNTIVKAGYEFAKATNALRELVLKGL